MMDGFAGVTTRETNGCVFTVRLVELFTDPKAAEMVTVPVLRAVARPVLSIETLCESDELQVTTEVMS